MKKYKNIDSAQAYKLLNTGSLVIIGSKDERDIN